MILFLLIINSSMAGFSQNVGIGVVNPLQKLHVAGNIRVDAMAAPGNAVITTNANGDLSRLNFTGNSNDVLKGNGSFGVASSLPSGAMVGSTNSIDSNLLNAGFSFYGEMPYNAFHYAERPGGISTQYELKPIYDKGNPGAQSSPSPRSLFCSAWSGSEMLIWGGINISGNYTFDFLNNGKRYNPNSDTWTPMNAANAPKKRGSASTVWTGTEMIVWGGYDSVFISNPVQFFYTNTGGKYNASTNSWSSVNQVGAPTARQGAPAVWTGTYMIVWGGEGASGNLSNGSRYNPVTNTWISTTIVGAPVSGGINTKMFWDASSGFVIVLCNNNTGARYNPTTNSWTTMASCPSGYELQSAVWTGSHLAVYNKQTHTMYKYSPSTNVWTTHVTAGDFPGSDISILQAVWSGFEIVYFTYHEDAQSNVTDNRLYRYNNGTNSFASSTFIVYNTMITSGNNLLIAGSMVLKWGGEMGQTNYGIDEYRQSSQGIRYYLSAGIAYPAYYYKNNINNVIYLYEKN